MSLVQRAVRHPYRLRNLYSPRRAITNKSTSLPSLTEEQAGIQELARSFTREHIIPLAEEYDRTMEYPWPVIKAAHQVGLLNVHIPEAYGGPGLGLFECALLSEELAYGCLGIQTAIQANTLAAAPVIVAGSEETKKKYLGRMTEEPLVAGYCVVSLGGRGITPFLPTRQDPVARQTQLLVGRRGHQDQSKEERRQVDLEWLKDDVRRLEFHSFGDGPGPHTLSRITNSGHANWFFVLAKSKRFTRARKSMTAFVVDANTPGVIIGKKEITPGGRCSDTRMVTFENVEVPEENVLGSVGGGYKVAIDAFEITRPLVASGAVGLAQRALGEALECAQERKVSMLTFMKTRSLFWHYTRFRTMGAPNVQPEAVAFMLAHMAERVEDSRALVWKAARAKDAGLKNASDASYAKISASRAAVENVDKAVQIFGGAGSPTEYPVEKLHRDAKIFEPDYKRLKKIETLNIAVFTIVVSKLLAVLFRS